MTLRTLPAFATAALLTLSVVQTTLHAQDLQEISDRIEIQLVNYESDLEFDDLESQLDTSSEDRIIESAFDSESQSAEFFSNNKEPQIMETPDSELETQIHRQIVTATLKSIVGVTMLGIAITGVVLYVKRNDPRNRRRRKYRH